MIFGTAPYEIYANYCYMLNKWTMGSQMIWTIVR